jgi:ribonuclease Z
VEVTFLGTSAGAPTTRRNVTAIAVRFEQRADWWLLDCGEGTQHRILNSPHLRSSRLTRIFITHVHGDHLLGLPGLLLSRSLSQGGVSPVDIHGPAAVGAWLDATRATIGLDTGYEVRFHAVNGPGLVFEDDNHVVRAAPAMHWGEAWCYRVEERPKPGRLDAAAVAQLGIPSGPWLAALARGETVTLPDGRVARGAELLGPPRRGRSFVFSGDTAGPNPTLVELARGADVLAHEATFADVHAAKATEVRHSTARQAGLVAAAAGVTTLVLTHISARYEGDDADVGTDVLLREANAEFPDVRLAHDDFRLELPRHE